MKSVSILYSIIIYVVIFLQGEHKIQVDKETVNKFSEDFKKTMTKSREELGIGENMLLEEFPEDVDVSFKKKTSEERNEEIQELLKSLEIDLGKLGKEQPKKIAMVIIQ